VADIDTGINYNHPDLTNIVRHAFSWYDSRGQVPLPGGDPDADPEPVDWRTEYPDNFGNDGFGHGTHTCGTIAAEGNNGEGVAGVCWNVDLVSYKGLSNVGGGNEWTLFGSLWHLAKWKKANYPHTIPVNLSIGMDQVGQFGIDMLEMALEHDIVSICSSGNDNSGFASFPGSFTGAIRVGAVDYRDKRASFSNWGQDMSVVAPGVDVYSTMG
jgi:subtilisin family serine protease